MRGDIQGLRAVAVLMVLLYHAELPFARGGFAGVDVFFVISGYLITGLIVAEIERTGGFSLLGFWARRVRRLLPAALVVLVTTAAATVLLLPPSRWAATAGDLTAAAGYVLNWRLAERSVDYLAAQEAPSPVQHFWSLAVEEQFYLLWPLLLPAVARPAARRGGGTGAGPRRALLPVVAGLGLASLAWSIRQGDAPDAFFVTTTRIWELCVGAVCALLVPHARASGPRTQARRARRRSERNRRLAAGLTWAGMLTLIAVTCALPAGTDWPGWAAGVPALATAAMITAGPAAGRAGAAWLVDTAPMRRIGDLSYVLYLWHWPMLVMAAAALGDLTTAAAAAVVVLSVLPALATHRWVEQPVRHAEFMVRHPWRAIEIGAGCTLTGVLAGLAVAAAVPAPPGAPPAAQRPGAVALLGDPAAAIPGPAPRSISPDPVAARADVPTLYHRGCETGYAASLPTTCRFGPSGAPTTVALVGDSRAAQWSPALQQVAAESGWRLITITKAGCPLADVMIAKGAVGHKRPYDSCRAWNEAVLGRLLEGPDRPDLLLTTAFSPYAAYRPGLVTRGADNLRELVAGFRRTWRELNEAGIPVVALRETPMMAQDVVDCVDRHRTRLEKCATPRREALSAAHIMLAASTGLERTTTIDLTSAVCPAISCPPVVGNVLVYRDRHHLTAQYARTLAPFLSSALGRLRLRGFAGGTLDAVLPRTL